MKLIIYIIFALTVTISVNAQSNSRLPFKDAPIAINNFMLGYPNVNIVDYSDLKNGNFLVYFYNEGKEMVFKIDNEGKLIQKETRISAAEIPVDLHTKFKQEGNFRNAWFIEKNNGEILYLVEFKKKLKFYDQVYNINGNKIPNEDYLASLLQ